jgi:hypothetical protein
MRRVSTLPSEIVALLMSILDAPKVAVVSNEKRGDDMEKPVGFTVEGSMAMTRAKGR